MAASPPGPAGAAETGRQGRALLRALPALALLAAADLSVVWGVLALGWGVLAVALVYAVGVAADGAFSRARARRARGGAAADAAGDRALVSEFFKTHLTIVVASALVAAMVFGGRLYRPEGAPADAYAPLATWQFWALAAALVGAEAFAHWCGFVRGGEAAFLPPEALVKEPLRRLFVLQGTVLILGFVVYWRGSTAAGLVALVVVKTAADVVLVMLERLRVARIRLAAGRPDA